MTFKWHSNKIRKDKMCAIFLYNSEDVSLIWLAGTLLAELSYINPGICWLMILVKAITHMYMSFHAPL